MDFPPRRNHMILLMAEILHLGWCWNPINNGISTTNLNWWVYRISGTHQQYHLWSAWECDLTQVDPRYKRPAPGLAPWLFQNGMKSILVDDLRRKTRLRFDVFGKRKTRGKDGISLGLSPLPVRVTTRIITFLVGNPYKPSFPLLLGGGTTQNIPMFDREIHLQRVPAMLV